MSTEPENTMEMVNRSTNPELETSTVNDQVVPVQSFVDRITLETLMNRTNYGKYLSKIDPKRHAEHQEFLSKLQKYKTQILEKTETMMNKPKTMYTNEVHETFTTYMKTMIRFLEVEEKNRGTNSDQEDDDMLFGWPGDINKYLSIV